jgi:hypothetical protein
MGPDGRIEGHGYNTVPGVVSERKRAGWIQPPSTNSPTPRSRPVCYTVRWRAGHMFILKLLFVAVAYVAWLYGHSSIEHEQSIVLPSLIALAANIWIVQSAFDHDYPMVKRWRDSFGIAFVITLLTLCAYIAYVVKITYPN